MKTAVTADDYRDIIMSEGDHIERSLLLWATGKPVSFHDLDYAWRALKRLGHETRNDAAIKDALDKITKT
jgi:hypothetical protein